MNKHFTGKIFLTLLLIFSLCADISMPAYASDTSASRNSSADKSDDAATADLTSEEDSASKDSSSDNTPSDDESTGDISTGKPSDSDSQDKNIDSGNTDSGNTSSGASSSESSSDKTPDKNTSDKDSSQDNTSEQDSLTDDALSEDIPADDTEDLTDQTEEALTPAVIEGETTFITLSAAGDCTLGIDSRYSHNFNKYYRKKGDSYFFKKVKSIFSNDDITIVNFEGTLTTAKKRARKTFTFKGPKKYANILKKGSVEVVNLANNHSKDYGNVSLTDTQNTMKKNNIGYCRNTTINYQTVKNVKTAFLGFNALGKTLTKKQVKSGITKAKNNGAQIIVVSFHWGVERKYYPNARQKSFGHYAIDCGASLVLGHHPHVLQGVEKYNGRYIVYSLGNFCFGGNSNPKDKDTMIFQQTFAVKDGILQPDNSAKIIPCSLSSHKKTNDFQPRILAGKDKKRLIKKMNKLSKKLKVSIDSNGNLN